MRLQAISFGGFQRPSSSASSSSAEGLSCVGTGTVRPLGELAMAKDEVKARLAPIPVYTVANPKNEFVLVAGEVRGVGCTAVWGASPTAAAT
jgi:Tic22-like family